MDHSVRRAYLLAAYLGLAACSNHSAKDKTDLSHSGGAATAEDPDSVEAQAIYDDVAAGTVSSQALEFTPDYALWSDGAEKRRWMLLPKGEQIDTSDMDHWRFPIGTKFVKEFSLDGVRLETRVIERVSDTGVLKKDLIMSTFVWNEDQTEARRTKDGVIDQFGTPHDVPKQKDCIACHIGEDSGTLGFSAIQLSASGMLARLERRGLLSDPPGRSFKLPGTDVERNAIGFLHANCAHCHTEGTPADTMRLRVLVKEVDLPFSEWDLYRSTVGVGIEKWAPRPERFETRIVPGDPEASALFYRMGQRDSAESVGEQMPPLATEVVNEEALEAVRAWIASMAPSEEAAEPATDPAPEGEGDAPAADDHQATPPAEPEAPADQSEPAAPAEPEAPAEESAPAAEA